MEPALRDSNGLIILDRPSCLALLATGTVAALAITEGALPVVLPVFYTLIGDDLVVGAAATGVLGRRLPGTVVSLCVYQIAPDLSNGWSVTVTGEAALLKSQPEDLRLPTWQPNVARTIVRISTDIVSGREIPAASNA
jgi:hypothetical protein